MLINAVEPQMEQARRLLYEKSDGYMPMPRFVILEHDHPTLHWDLMLEAGDALHTWRLAQAPQAGAAIAALALGDHRLIYLDYEGPVSGGRGTVKRWDAGEFKEEAGSLPSLRRLGFRGATIRGPVILEKEGDDWRFRWS